MARSLNEIKNYLKSQFYYDVFCYNVNNQRALNIDEFIKREYVKNNCRSLINDAFTWGKTIEGGDFWSTCSNLYSDWFYAGEHDSYATLDEFLKSIQKGQIF